MTMSSTLRLTGWMLLLVIIAILVSPFIILWSILGLIVYRLIWSRLWLPYASSQELLKAERDMLDHFAEDKKYGISIESKVIAGLGTLIVSSSSIDTHEEAKSLVFIHGYMGGNAYWSPCLGELSRRFKVICVEMRGWGRSDRPYHKETSGDEVLAYFAATMEAWRQEMGLESFILVGHSLGSHCASAYATKYPWRIEHLIIASPPGVLPPPSEATSSPSTSPSPPSFIRAIFRLLITTNTTVGSIIRWLGPFSQSIVKSRLQARARRSNEGSFFRSLNKEQLDCLAKYFTSNFSLPPSGESVLGVYFHLPKEGNLNVRKPLITWLRGPNYIKVHDNAHNRSSQDALILDDKMPSNTGFIQCPFSIIFGARNNDWFYDKKGSLELCKQLEDDGIPHARFYEMTKAGHVVFLDDTKEFCELVCKCVDDVGVPVAINSTAISATLNEDASRI